MPAACSFRTISDVATCPLSNQRVRFAIVFDPPVSGSKPLVENQVCSFHYLEEGVCKTIRMRADRNVPITGSIDPKRAKPLERRAGPDCGAASFHGLVGFAGDQGGQGPQHRDIDVLTHARSPSLVQRREQANHGKKRCGEITQRQSDPYRRISLFP